MGKYFYLVIWDWWWRLENPFYSCLCGLWWKSTFLCCPWIFCAVLHKRGRRQFWFLPLCSLVYSHFWHSDGAQVTKKQLSGNFSKGEEDEGGAWKTRITSEYLLSSSSLWWFCQHQTTSPCLLCRENIWRGAQPSFLLQPHYVCINGINSWENIFILTSPSVLSFSLGRANRVLLKKFGKKERKEKKHFDVQMAPNKEFCSANSRFCCDVIGSKCILGYQTKTAQNSWFEMLDMLEPLCVPKASPWYPAKS